jgi:hypothetical protein
MYKGKVKEEKLIGKQMGMKLKTLVKDFITIFCS